MRVPVSLLSLSIVAALAALPAVSAQDEDGPPGCVEANPCEFIIAVDEDGLADVSVTEFSEGDWLVATVVNHDSVEHTVKLADHALSMTVGGGDVEDSNPFRVGPAGNYPLTDQPTNDVQDITILEDEDFGSGSSSDDEESRRGSPGLAPLALMAVVVLAVLIVSRRR